MENTARPRSMPRQRRTSPKFSKRPVVEQQRPRALAIGTTRYRAWRRAAGMAGTRRGADLAHWMARMARTLANTAARWKAI